MTADVASGVVLLLDFTGYSMTLPPHQPKHRPDGDCRFGEQRCSTARAVYGIHVFWILQEIRHGLAPSLPGNRRDL